MTIFPRLQFWIAIILVCVLASCGRVINIKIVDIALIDHPETFVQVSKTYLNQSDTVAVVGMLKATIETNFNLTEFAKNNDWKLGNYVSGCKSGIELDVVRPFFDVAFSQTDIHKYTILLNYKSLPKNKQKYNLALHSEQLCFTVKMVQGMNVFTINKSKVFRYELPEKIKTELLSYEQRGGLVRYKRMNEAASALYGFNGLEHSPEDLNILLEYLEKYNHRNDPEAYK